VQTLAELAPIRKGGRGDLLAAEHIHDIRSASAASRWARVPSVGSTPRCGRL
jgi:hypothetical protein